MSNAAADLRNLAFVGHPSAGKTTLVDALAHALGASDRKGSVADRTSICDVEPEEHDRQHTLSLAAVHAEKDGLRWNLVDTPGYPEFLGDATSGMLAADVVVGVVSASSGVTFNLLQKMRAAAELGRARAIVLTHLDAENVDLDELVGELRARIGEVCVPVLLPDATGQGLSKVESVLDTGSQWRKRFMDRVMDACEDEELLMQYLDSETLSDDDLRRNAPVAIAKGALVPVLACNPASDLGVAEVAAWLAAHAPSPALAQSYSIAGEKVPCDPDGDLLGVVLNVHSDPHVGRVCLARILRGTLHAHEAVGAGKGEKLGGLFHPVGGRGRQPAEEIHAGDLAVFTKVEGIGWGGALVHAGSEPPTFDLPELPRPMVSLAVAPKTRSDEQKIGTALAKLTAEDPCFRTESVKLTHELVMHGMSDLHLQVMEERLKRRYGVEIETRQPRIAYRETITKPSEGHHRHKKQTGGRGQFGECYLRMRPGAEDSGIVFHDKIVGGSIPKNLIPAVEKGVRELASTGVMTTSQVVDVEVEVYDGKFHAVDSDEASFKKAGAMAFRDGFLKAGPVLLEPVMEVEIHIPSDAAGSVFSDLTSHRRGQVIDQASEADGAITIVRANVPLATMQTYHRDLKSQTAGEGSYRMELAHYAPVPANEQQKILAEFGKKVEEE